MNPQSQSSTTLNIMAALLTQPNFRPINQNALFLSQYLPTPYDLMVSRAQALNSTSLTENYRDQNLNDVKAEFPVKFETKCEFVAKPAKLEASEQDIVCNGSEITTPSYIDQPLTQTDLRPELEKIVRFLLFNMGKDNEALIRSTRNCYRQNSSLLEVYDKLSMKYYSAKKCKEDIIRYILRKVFRHLRMSIMKNEKVTSKKASLLMCKRYFKPNAEPCEEIEDEEKFLESLMPYNKNSKNKTMNINFVLEIFSSADFCKEYQDFLPELYKVVVEENQKKEKKLVSFILECIQKNCLERLSAMHRLPWLDVWTEDAKNLAIAIMPGKRLVYNGKKPKN